MVQLPNRGNLRPDSVPPVKEAAAVKLEIEDPLGGEHGPVNKRPKVAASPHQAIHYNLIAEPSPLGLHLRKSPSLVDLIQMTLNRANAEAKAKSCVMTNGNLEAGRTELKSTAVSATRDKMKASNFPVSLLRIGTWEGVSRYDGDLVAKCYYAKHKLVWEVLEGSLKSKIEIQLSNIMALKATCPENGPGTLDIVLARPPIFFKETNPQPRKHTLWQATADFTHGQASIHRRHFLQCSEGLLNKHFEKLIQCDPRLKSLSQQPEFVLESPYFETPRSVFEVQDGSKCHGFDNPKENHVPIFSGFCNSGSPCAAPSTSTKSDEMDPVGTAPDLLVQGTPSSVMYTQALEEKSCGETEELKNPSLQDQLNVPGLRGSMSMSDPVNDTEHCISEQKPAGNPLLLGDGLPTNDLMEDLAQYLLSDLQAAPAFDDEQSLMSRVNLFCHIIQNDPDLQASQDVPNDEHNSVPEALVDGQQPPRISRKDSFAELLMHLPRIASLPQFLV